MDYQTALDFILSFADYERIPRSGVVWDLARIEKLLERLGKPQYAAKSVHIAGTKGKGSTSAMIASILTHAGYKTGLYTSPHLLSITERIQVDGQLIPEEAFARATELMKPDVEWVNRFGGLGELTTFELLTALAFVYYREIAVDYQVMEVGLGGRFDATNVVKPEVCVLTSISYDHMDVLGDTLDKIAAEKAGIIKSGSTVVCAPQFPEAMAVIEKVCREKGARLIRIGNEVTWQLKDFNIDGQSFKLKGLIRDYDLCIPLLGEYQLENAASAVTAAEVLSSLGTKKVASDSIAAGLAQVRWPGRLQVLRRKPWLIIDGAHNAYSARRLVEALRKYFSFARAILIFGVSTDKDIGGMVVELAPLTSELIVTASHHPRAAKAALLVDEFSKVGIKPQVAENVASAVDIALATAKPDDLICVTGSIFVIAQVMEYLPKRG